MLPGGLGCLLGIPSPTESRSRHKSAGETRKPVPRQSSWAASGPWRTVGSRFLWLWIMHHCFKAKELRFTSRGQSVLSLASQRPGSISSKPQAMLHSLPRSNIWGAKTVFWAPCCAMPTTASGGHGHQPTFKI